ncbi:GGDEF domain-containing protein [Cyanobium sp. FACHB-13342]|uniref:GGDEF domain-containing protein n=1 Tax=Cyanobium sp. FACHB-13342 TaxID=2692793 RepID=UPI0016815FCC|nr:GGDEF domain-containing protein [Cyanobium sp. FACHB-13342]MBD2424126.1 GGDEF domain-containing protein [Cyanobium sp. FACHB-13342]
MVPLPAASATAPSRQQALVLALFTGLAVLLNLQPLPLFYGIQVLLGSTLPILALLLWRTGWCIPMGCIASLVTWKLWGHPWAVVIFTAELVWLTLGLGQLGRRSIDRSTGAIIPLAISYWIVLGSPLVALFYGLILKIDATNVAVTALKQSFNGILNTTIAFVLYVLISAIENRKGMGSGISLRGVIVGLVLLITTIPTLFITMASGYQLELAVQQAELDNLKAVNQAVAASRPLTELPGGDVAYRHIEANGKSISSDPELFARLDKSFTDGGRSYVHPRELSVLISRQPLPMLKKWINGYWSYSQLHRSSDQESVLIQVVQPAATLVKRMQNQSAYLLGVVLVMLVLGTIASMALGALFEREVNAVLRPLLSNNDGIATLAPSLIIELRMMVQLVNQRIQQTRLLADDLREANLALRRSRDELEQLNTSDVLTGCGNRAALFQRLKEECHRSRRTGEPLSCLTLDVDGLTAINDRFGHETGDLVLKRVASAVRLRLRITDHFFRSGGDEFVVIATDCDGIAAQEMATELRALVRELGLTDKHGQVPTSISIGISSLTGKDQKPDTLLARSDAALRVARKQATSGIATEQDIPRPEQPG